MQKRDLYYDRIPTKLLRENVRYLGNILGKVLKDQEGDKFFELVEKVRRLSKANKTNLNNKLSYRKIIRTIKYLSTKNTFKITSGKGVGKYSEKRCPGQTQHMFGRY